MGKKVKKKARSGHKEKRVATSSPITVSQQDIPSVEIVGGGVSVATERKACAHLDKGVDLVKVSSKIGSSAPIRCEDCREGVVDRRTSKGKGKHGKKKGGGSVDSRPESKAIWVCLECGHFSCGGIGFPTIPQSHAVRHASQNRHPLAVQFENLHLRWCFPCDTLIPVEKSEENGEQRDVLADIVKIIKGRSSEGASVDVEDVWFGSGSVTSEIKLKNTLSGSLDERGGYVVTGLVNMGNTCFFNSVMQNLLAMDRLRDYFSKLDGSVGPLTIALKKLYNETSPETGLRNVITPKSFFGCVCAKAPQFRGYQQHDSHELLRCLLDGLSMEELSARKQINSSQEDGFSPNLGPTFVDAIFGGQLSSTVCCLECGHLSTVYEPFLDLSLPVPTKKPPSKKAQPIARAKKSKLPPKRSGRIRSKVNRDTDPVPAQSMSNPPNISKSSYRVESSAAVVEKSVASSVEVTSSESINLSTVVNDKVMNSQSLSATQECGNKQFSEKAREETVASVEDFTWLDYVEPDIVPNHHDMTIQNDDVLVIQDSGNEDAVQNEVLLCNNVESSSQVCSPHTEKTAASLGDLTSLDYIEPGTSSDNHDRGSEINGKSVIHDSGNKNAVKNNAFFLNDSESSSQVCSFYTESNQKVDSSGNSWEDELPLQAQGSEVLLLPYKEETSTSDEVLRGEGEISSSAVGYEQDSLDFDGFGDLFNEPEVAAGPNMKPLSSNNDFQANEAAETGFLAGNCSESDPDEVDNTDSPVSIDSCLAYFTKAELLTNEHAWHCENCSKALQEQRMKLGKRQKPMPKIGINGNEDRIQNSPSGLDKYCPFPIEARNLNNGNIKRDVLDTFDESLTSHNCKIDENENCIVETNQKDELNTVASQLKEGQSEMNDALPELSQSYSSHKTGSPASFSGQACDSCSVHEPSSAGCKTDKVQHRESQSSAGRCESEGSEDEEMDSVCVKVKRDATKRILIDRAPPILTIHLKRFSQDARGRLSKLNGHVVFKDSIDLRPYMDPRSRCTEGELYEYRLVGVVEHMGTMRGGHYVAYVRSTKSMGKVDKENRDFVWYQANDAYVREASLEEVLRCEAYILFYEKI
ncbi:hypothetical protein F0562_035205 [Nyssa sinensis]|uniref:ubiquitinyl hydrolase 1 n=1 Tax=Nyssa sinensis TaxID=561372 RepID=A0A5J5ADX8_9ASTE|nr:hypothetical protein F0562_035205 [Nyssa sinensis]